MKADLPLNEILRIKSLHDLAILDTPREQSFDDVAHVAMQLCDVPIAVVSLIDTDRQWFKSCIGLDGEETSRDIAFCAHAILTPEDVLIVEDATKDYRFADNELVVGPPYIRFYAGAPLVTEDGFALGTLCVVDYKTRKLSSAQINALRALANQVMQLVRLKSTSDAIQKHSARLQTIADSVPVLIGELDEHSRYIFVNKQYQVWFGKKAEDIIGKTPQELLPDNVAEKIMESIGRCQQGKSVSIEVSLPCNVELAINYIPCVESKQTNVYEVAVDITEHKRLEKIKEGLISTVSHELRTPLTSISGALSLIANNMLGALPDKAQSILKIAYKNSQRLNLLINDLLDMEKLIAGKMHFDFQYKSLPSLVQQAVIENEAYANKYEVTYRIHNTIGDAHINVDSFRLQQVLSNFLSNAAKYSQPKGHVDIELSSINGWFRVAVRDYGSGVPEAFKSQIFQKFAQADSSDTRQKGGTGLGLAVSKELVEHMGGRIGFDSELKTGACFYAEFKQAFDIH